MYTADQMSSERPLERAIEYDMNTCVLSPLLEETDLSFTCEIMKTAEDVRVLCVHLYQPNAVGEPIVATLLVELDTFKVGFTDAFDIPRPSLASVEFGDTFSREDSAAWYEERLTPLLSKVLK